jgi:multidrug efflux pump subunit AcrB
VGLARLYGKPVASTTGLLIVLVCAGAFVAGARLGPSGNGAETALTVIIDHFGVDAREIERTITRPLEDELGSLPGLKTLRSLSDYGSARVTLFMRSGSSEREAYLMVRDAVDRLYVRLPGSVQRPRIVTSGGEGRPFFIVSVRSQTMNLADLASLLEKELKPSLEKLEGAAEVEVGGGTQREVHVVLDEERVTRAGLDAESVARAIQANELLAPLGVVYSRGRELAVVLRGRLESLEALRAMRVPVAGTSTVLGSIARVQYAPRERGEISRVDGVENAVLAVKSSGGANLVELSRLIRSELSRWEMRGLEFGVILDAGAELEKSLKSILEAILFAVVVSAVTLPLFLSGVRRVFVISASIPVIGLASAAAVTAAGFSLDVYILSGLAVGIGTMIDTGIILAGKAVPGTDRGSYFKEAEHLVPALLSSAFTSLIVLVPLLTLDGAGGGVRRVSFALATLMAASFILSCLFVPPYAAPLGVRSSSKARRPGPLGRVMSLGRRRTRAFMEMAITACASFIHAPIIGAVIAAGAGIWAVATIGIDLEPPLQSNSIPVHVEYESGASIESVDSRTASFTARVRGFAGVTVVQGTARQGSAEMEVGFDPSQVTREGLSSQIRALGASVPGGFAYLPEGLGTTERSLEIVVTGEDDRTLKAYAAEAAQHLRGQRVVREVVLNFKEPSESFEFRIDPNRSAAAGATAESVAGALRWHLYGPVALKWLGTDKEMDVRVIGGSSSPQTLESLARVPVRVGNSRWVPLVSTGRFLQLSQGGKLYRLNRQRAAYLTVHIAAGDIRQIVRTVENALSEVTLAPGYTFDVGRDLVEQAQRFRTLWMTFLLCVMLVFVVLGVLTESFRWPLVILAVLPPSLTFPLVIMRLSGQRLVVPVLIGLIVLSGMAVNNSILIVDACRSRGPRRPRSVTDAVLSRLSALTATSAVTILGHVPLLFAAGEGAGFMRSLAFVIIWGIAGSYAATILLVPALMRVALMREGAPTTTE